jgi:hypothetical protein
MLRIHLIDTFFPMENNHNKGFVERHRNVGKLDGSTCYGRFLENVSLIKSNTLKLVSFDVRDFFGIMAAVLNPKKRV